MKKTFLACLLGVSTLAASAQTFTEWKDPLINSINRAPMHASYFAYESKEKAIEDNRELSKNFLSLNGKWKFQWVKDAPMRSTTFFNTTYDDKAWDEIDVPAMWELRGYGDPVYVNQRYEWDYLIKPEPAVLPEDNNHVGSYRREIEIPSDWTGKKVYLHFGAVSSNVYVWVNGRFVGYSEDSKLEAEFDVTPYLKKGKNLVAFQVFRWSDGKYVECQDFWRFTGVSRDVYMYARNPQHVKDYKVVSTLGDNYSSGLLSINAETTSQGGTLLLELKDKRGNVVWKESKPAQKTVSAQTQLESVEKWSAEDPNLYQLSITLLDNKKNIIESIQQRVGFKRVEVKDGRFLVNGKGILIKGVNRHEMDADEGYYVSRAQMEEDIKVLKENNFNAVRTSHYPDDPYWYQLCDEHGIYIVDEANVEAHGYEGIADMKNWMNTHLERTTRMVDRDKNAPCVIAWSMGNESGDGINFRESYRKMKEMDSTRPVQYQRAEKKDHTDVYVPFYVNYPELIKHGESKDDTKPLIQCEYAHAMGNSMGGFKEYWDIYRKYPNVQGGFIWDFADQGVRDYRNGKMIYSYGGDYGHDLPSDNNFCNNGLFNPDREPNPHVDEVRTVMQSIWTTPLDLKKGEISIFNENFFIDLSNVYLEWSIVENGIAVRTGIVKDLNIQPQAKSKLTLGYTLNDNTKEKHLNVYYRLKDATSMLPAGFEIAKEQFEITPYQWADAKLEAKEGKLLANETRYLSIVSGKDFEFRFNKSNGLLSGYTWRGEEFMQADTYLTPNFWRAVTDNDMGAGLQKKLRAWKNPELKLNSIKTEKKGDLVEIKSELSIVDLDADLTITYVVNSQGEMKVTQSMKAKGADKPMLLRFGMQMTYTDKFDRIAYYGRGPIENYSDRKLSTFVSQYDQTVAEQYYPYVRPQETGNKSDLRWWNLTQQGGRGVQIVSDKAFNATALNYTVNQLDEGLRKAQRHGSEMEVQPFTVLSIDYAQMGLGCVDSWWSLPIEKYWLSYGDYEYSFIIKPLK